LGDNTSPSLLGIVDGFVEEVCIDSVWFIKLSWSCLQKKIGIAIFFERNRLLFPIPSAATRDSFILKSSVFTRKRKEGLQKRKVREENAFWDEKELDFLQKEQKRWEEGEKRDWLWRRLKLARKACFKLE